MKLEIPSVDKFKNDADEIIKTMLNHGIIIDVIETEITRLAIAQGLLRAYADGGNTTLKCILDDVEQKIQLIRSESVTKA